MSQIPKEIDHQSTGQQKETNLLTSRQEDSATRFELGLSAMLHQHIRTISGGRNIMAGCYIWEQDDSRCMNNCQKCQRGRLCAHGEPPETSDLI